MSRTHVRLLAVLTASAASAVLAAPTATAAPQTTGLADLASSTCAPVHARGNGVDHGDGTTSATVRVQRVTVGTTNAAFTVTGVVGTVASFEGAIDFADAAGLGTIHAPVTGTLDVATGAFRSHSDTVTGGGAFTGVTGSLTFVGHENLTTLKFTERIVGELCAP